MVDGQTAYLSFARDDDRMWMLETFVPPPLEGHGIAGRLTRYGLDHARTSGLAVAPICPYVAAYIQRHPGYQDLVA